MEVWGEAVSETGKVEKAAEERVKAGLWDEYAAPLLSVVFKKMLPTMLAVGTAVGGVLYVRDRQSGVPESNRRAADGAEALVTELTAMKSEVSGLKSDLSLVRTDVTSLREAVSAAKDNTSGLRADVSGMRSDIAALWRFIEQRGK